MFLRLVIVWLILSMPWVSIPLGFWTPAAHAQTPSSQTQADLVAEDIWWTPLEVNIGDQVFFGFRVHNAGTASSGPFKILFRTSSGGVPLTCASDVADLSAKTTLLSSALSGQGTTLIDGIAVPYCNSSFFQIEAPAGGGGITFLLYVDRSNQVQESIESNNILSESVAVTAPPSTPIPTPTPTPTPAPAPIQCSVQLIPAWRVGDVRNIWAAPGSERYQYLLTLPPDTLMIQKDGNWVIASTGQFIDQVTPGQQYSAPTTTFAMPTCTPAPAPAIGGGTLPIQQEGPIPLPSVGGNISSPPGGTTPGGEIGGQPSGNTSGQTGGQPSGNTSGQTSGQTAGQTGGQATSPTGQSQTSTFGAAVANAIAGAINNSPFGLAAALLGNNNLAATLGITNTNPTNITTAVIGLAITGITMGIGNSALSLAINIAQGIIGIVKFAISLFSGKGGDPGPSSTPGGEPEGAESTSEAVEGVESTSESTEGVESTSEAGAGVEGVESTSEAGVGAEAGAGAGAGADAY